MLIDSIYKYQHYQINSSYWGSAILYLVGRISIWLDWSAITGTFSLYLIGKSRPSLSSRLWRYRSLQTYWRPTFHSEKIKIFSLRKGFIWHFKPKILKQFTIKILIFCQNVLMNILQNLLKLQNLKELTFPAENSLWIIIHLLIFNFLWYIITTGNIWLHNAI